MQTQRPADALSRRLRQGHVTALGDRAGRPAAIGFQVIGSHQRAAFVLGDEDRVLGPPPIIQRRRAADVARLRIGFTGAEGRLQDCPQRIVVRARAGADTDQISISPVMYSAQSPWMMVRAPSSVQSRSPPRAEACRAFKVFLPSRFAQKGVRAQCAEPVTGSSGTPK